MMNHFLVDEHLPKWWPLALSRLCPGLAVWHVGDVGAPALQSADPVLLDWCEEHSFLLITNNRHSMPTHLADHVAAGHHIPGILVVDPARPIAAVAEDLLLIAEASYELEFRDQIRFLPVA